ncbi:MAG: glutathione binding-like protein [Hyphomicrobiales bacterium]|nr:glutathione binding-like protein [Hyphomicrobiales bacterium]
MADYRLHCFGESGNSYKAALMLELSGCDWAPLWVPFFEGATRTAEWREGLNRMGEAPVLVHGQRVLTQSGVILDYLAEETGKFAGRDADEKREIWRWILFDNHKFTSYFATLRFMLAMKKMPESPVTEFLRGRVIDAYKVVEKQLTVTDWLTGDRPTIADLSLSGYVFYDEDVGLDRWAMFPAIDAWRDRLKALPGWKGPWDLMPMK